MGPGYMKVTRIFGDRLGSTRATSTNDPYYPWSSTTRNYYPFGEEITSTANNDYKFASTYRDSATGLDYAVNRYYASGTGRFLTPDYYTRSAGADSPQTFNRYNYAGNDPVNMTDPDGLFVKNVPPTPPDPGTREGEEIEGPRGEGQPPEGGGGPSGFIRVANPSKSGPNQGRIRNVMTWIGQSIDDDCSGWLAGVGDTIRGLLGNPDDESTVLIGHGTFDTRKIAAFTGNNPNQTDLPAGYAVTVNDAGAFFVGSYTENGQAFSLSANGYTGGTSQAQVAILLHELAHSIGASGFQSDFNNSDAGSANDRLVRQHCQRTLDAARNIP
jgi:RHS repeat-associated protein